jgi:aminoglycoside phosphotransferase (APT) family kinase protein
MDRVHEMLILAAFPPGATITDFQPYRPGYRAYPMRVMVATAAGASAECVLKVDSPIERVMHEARVLVALAELGLVVPAVLSGPSVLPHTSPPAAGMVLSVLPGEPLAWLGLTDLATANQTCQLVLEGVLRLQHLTPAISAHAIASQLPQRTLAGEFDTLLARGGPGLKSAPHADAVAFLRTILPTLAIPLVFSNGDYNPLNFLHRDGRLTGWVDFENACFEDPLIGFAKFMVWAYDDYGWGTGQKVGLVERYLYRQNASRAQFRPRLILRCLQFLQDGASVPQEGNQNPRAATLRVLADTMAEV